MKCSKDSLWITLLAGLLATAATCISANAQSFAYVPNGTTVSVIDTGTNTVVATVSGLTSPFGVALTPNGSFAYVTNFQNGTVSVIDRTNTVVSTVPGFSTPFGIAVTPNGAFAYVANLSGHSVGVINTATNVLVATVPLPNSSQPVEVAITPNGALVYVSDQGTNSVSVISTATNAVVALVPVGANPAALAVTPNGALVYVTNFGSTTVSVISTTTNSVVATVPVGTKPVGVAVRPDGAIAYVTNRDDNTVSAISTATNTVLSVIGVGNGPNGVAITTDGAFAYVVNQFGGTVSVIETAGNAIVATIPIVLEAQIIAISPADNDSGFSQLSGDNSFSGNQTIAGNVTATSFSGNGSGLTGVTSSNLSCAGCVGNTQLAVNYAAADTQGGNALNALKFGGQLPTAYPTLGANTFSGTQSMPGLSAGTINSTFGIFFGSRNNAVMLAENTMGAPGIGVEGVGDSGGIGVLGVGETAVVADGHTIGVDAVGSKYGVHATSTNSAGSIAGVFNSLAPNGKILSGQNNGTEVFSIASDGSMTSSGSLATSGPVTIGGGTPIAEYVSVTDNISVSAMNAGSCVIFSTAVAGFTAGASDTIALGIPGSLVNGLGIIYQAWENPDSGFTTIIIQACNVSGARYKGGATGTIRIDIFKH